MVSSFGIEVVLDGVVIWSYKSANVPVIGDWIKLPFPVRKEHGLIKNDMLRVISREIRFFEANLDGIGETIVINCQITEAPNTETRFSNTELRLIDNALDRVLGRFTPAAALCDQRLEGRFIDLSNKVQNLIELRRNNHAS